MLGVMLIVGWKLDGWAEFRCPAESVSIWVKKDAKGREEFSKAG
jgi:hypothetical protein